MKIAITAHGVDCKAAVDSRFSRAKYFVLYDQEKGIWDSIPNVQNQIVNQGVGIQRGQELTKIRANILITGYIGPKDFKVLQAGHIDMYSLGEISSTVEDALAAFLSGNLTVIAAPNALDLKK